MPLMLIYSVEKNYESCLLKAFVVSQYNLGFLPINCIFHMLLHYASHGGWKNPIQKASTCHTIQKILG